VRRVKGARLGSAELGDEFLEFRDLCLLRVVLGTEVFEPSVCRGECPLCQHLQRARFRSEATALLKLRPLNARLRPGATLAEWCTYSVFSGGHVRGLRCVVNLGTGASGSVGGSTVLKSSGTTWSTTPRT
jgi:hypothetical protein